MNIIDELLNYIENNDKNRLITTDIKISNYELNVVVVKILSWLKLEYKRSVWIAEGKRKSFKPLEIDMQYSWCSNLYRIVEKEKLFSEYFSIKDGKFDFSHKVNDEDKTIARKKVYLNYNPKKHIKL